jgi:hypothetical protein
VHAFGGISGTGTSGTAGTDAGPAPSLQVSLREALGRITAVLWKQAPDEELVQRATDARVATTRDLQPFVREILNDRRSALGVGAFYRWWLDLDAISTTVRDSALFPAYTPELQTDMASETETFGVEVTLTQNETFQTLMTAPFSYLNERLAALYGVAGVTGDDLRLVILPSSERAGLLTQPSLQTLGAFAYRNSPSHRGSNVLRTFFCLDVPSAPPNVAGLDPIPSNMTVRQALAQDTSDPSTCRPCHVAIDPAGLAFERFDAIGRSRTTDNGAPVDTSGLELAPSFGPTRTAPIQVNGAVDLARAVAVAPDAQACFARKWLSFALGRDVDDSDAPSLDQIRNQFVDSGFNIKELVIDTLTSDSFLGVPLRH